jgi:peptide/nickel transport system substrate-binding protein
VAGWVGNGVVRAKDGIELSVEYCTSASSVRQMTQAAVMDGWEQLGINVTPCVVEPGVFFDRSAVNEQNIGHFYRDVQMYTSGPASPFPIEYFRRWYAGPDNANVAQRANMWSGRNNQRYINPEFDALYDEVTVTTDPARAAELFIQMNDIVIMDCVAIPLVARAAANYAISNRLINDNIAASSWEVLYWNIANWTAAHWE